MASSSASGQNGEQSQLSRAMALGSYFLSGAMVINASQFLGAPLQLINNDWYNAWIAWTKESFGLLTMTMTQWWAPTIVKVSGDKSMRGQLTKNADGTLKCSFPNRLVLMANHQIYTDWMYLWWIAYTNGMHGRLYIILKESLKNIPVLGWGMQLSQFIFMKRNWEQDKPNMQKHLQKLNRPSEPMWLMLFPEGTNLAPDTRERSRAWARKNEIKDMQHQLLPRSTGLHFCLQQLRGSMEYLYDCTIAYEGVKRGEYAQDVFTIKSSYIEGHPPSGVHIYWRRYAISSIPLEDSAVFEKWLRARWREKDYLIEMWHRTGQFPSDSGAERIPNGQIRRGCGHIETQVRPAQWYEFLQIFAPMGVLALVLSVFYGALPEWFMKAATKDAIQAESTSVPKVSVNGSEKGFSWLSFFNPDKQGGIVQQLLGSLIPTTNVTLPAPEAPEEVDKKVATVKNNFMQRMQDEEKRRKTHQKKSVDLKSAQKPTVSFSEALKGEESKRRGSVATTYSKAPSVAASEGDFWQRMREEKTKRNGSVISAPSRLSSVNPAPAAGDKLKAEQVKRKGSVVSASGMPPPSKPKLGPSKAKSQPMKAGQSTSSSTTKRAQAGSNITKVAPKKPAPKLSSVNSNSASGLKNGANDTKATPQVKSTGKTVPSTNLPSQKVTSTPVKRLPIKKAKTPESTKDPDVAAKAKPPPKLTRTASSMRENTAVSSNTPSVKSKPPKLSRAASKLSEATTTSGKASPVKSGQPKPA